VLHPFVITFKKKSELKKKNQLQMRNFLKKKTSNEKLLRAASQKIDFF